MARGFTLLEVLLAVAITALIGVGAAQLLNSIINAKQGVDIRSEKLASLQRFNMAVSRDIEQIINRPIRDIYGDEQPAIRINDGDYPVEFTRAGWRNSPVTDDPRSELQRVAYRLEPDTAIAELDLLWRREMLTLAYNARWLHLRTSEGIKRGLGFVANPKSPAYAPPMPFGDTVSTVAKAIGFNGHCYDYLFDTLAGIKEYGIHDAAMEKLANAVSQRLASTR